MKTFEIVDYIQLIQEFELLTANHPNGVKILRDDLINHPYDTEIIDPNFDPCKLNGIEDYLWALNPWIYYHPFLMWKELKKIVLNEAPDTHLIEIISEFFYQTVELIEEDNKKSMSDDVLIYFDILLQVYLEISPSRNLNKIDEIFYDIKKNSNLLYTRKYQPIRRYLDKHRKYVNKILSYPQGNRPLLNKFKNIIRSNPTGYGFYSLLELDKNDFIQNEPTHEKSEDILLEYCNYILYAITIITQIKNLTKNSMDETIFQPILRCFLQKNIINAKFLEKMASGRFIFNEFLFNLISLGHCEYDPHIQNCHVCQPLLSKISGIGNDTYFLLSGARHPILKNVLKTETRKNTKIEFIEELHKNDLHLLYPSVIYLKGDSSDVKVFVKELNKKYFDSYNILISSDQYLPIKLLEYSIDIQKWFDSIKQRIKNNLLDPEPSANCLKEVYDVKIFKFKPPRSNSQTSLVRAKFTDYNINYFLKFENKYIKIDYNELSWAKIYILSLSSIDFIFYDLAKSLLAIPRAINLPVIIKRCLISCSGFLPVSIRLEKIIYDRQDRGTVDKLFSSVYDFDRFFYVYKMIPYDFSVALSKKLGITNIIRVKITI